MWFNFNNAIDMILALGFIAMLYPVPLLEVWSCEVAYIPNVILWLPAWPEDDPAGTDMIVTF